MSDQPAVDKDLLYGDFRKAAADRHELAMKAAHKALDLAEDDDVNIGVNKTVNGVGAKGLVGAALAAGLPTAGLAVMLLLRPMPPAAPVPVATIPAIVAPQEKPAPVAPPVVPPAQGEWDAVYEQKVRLPDGTWVWKETKRERLKTK